MNALFLATKVQIPPPPQHGVRRARLIDALEHGLLHAKLVLISAPAGYGKTTLLSQWAEASRFPVAWLSISEEDNDLERFLRYLLLGWEELQPDVSKSPLGLLLGARSPDTEAVLAAFINVANNALQPIVFVLDDYHLIEEPAIHVALTFLLDHLPPALHFVLAGRSEPPLPLARYRARGNLREFRAEDLSFEPEETRDFLNEMMGLDLVHDEVTRLQGQLEGWIAGLQLVALTLKRRLTRPDKLVVTGRHRFIADYLSEEVLSSLPDDIQQFLLQTSLLDRLCGSLCAAITEGEGGQAMLERLERENLFLVPLDDSREWYRYHQLFAGFLQAELHRRYPDEVVSLHCRAARWYLAHNLPEQAFHHAVEGSDADLVMHIFERYLVVKLFGGEFRMVKRWLDSLPSDWYPAYPLLSLAQSVFLALTGAFDACVRCLDEVEQSLAHAEGEATRWPGARVTAMRCLVACIQNDLPQAETYAYQALQVLPADDFSYRADIHHALGDTYRQNGRWAEAREHYVKALDFTASPAYRLQSAQVLGALADLDLKQGRLRDAAGYWREALAVMQERENWGQLPLPAIGWVYIRLGEILYEWNELAEAGDHLSLGLERAELGGDVRALLAGYLLAGRLSLAAGDITAAAEYMERMRHLVEKAPFPDWRGRFERFQLELWLAQDRVRTAVNWVKERWRNIEGEERPESETAQLVAVRVLNSQGDTQSLEPTLALLEHLRQAAETTGRLGVNIEALALQALAHWRRGDRAGAMAVLERALRLAEPEGYVRLFADLGLPMVWLLQEARTRGVMADYVAELLAACGPDLTLPASAARALPEPLSLREQEVLQLIAAGLTNREIAAHLVVSPETVKKHTGSIYGKLGVRSRTEAVARARELDLLG